MCDRIFAVMGLMLLLVHASHAAARAEGIPRQAEIASFIARLYGDLLGRTASRAESTAWTYYFASRCSSDGLGRGAVAFVASQEFALQPLTLDQFVSSLYTAFLNRRPEPDGLIAWIHHFRQVRLSLVSSFLSSDEWARQLPGFRDRSIATAFVLRLYLEILDRQAAPAEVDAWVAYLVPNPSPDVLRGVVMAFLASAEFERRSLSLFDYVAVLYRALLGRPPDQGGWAAWVDLLQQRVVQSVGQTFPQSPEFAGLVAQLLCPPGPLAFRPLYGLDFSPYVDGQDPNRGSVVSEPQLRARLQIVAPYTQWVRFFGSTAGLQNGPRVAREFGLDTACSAWIGRDPAANDREVVALIDNATRGYCDLLIVGSEVLLRGDQDVAYLINQIARVKGAAPSLPVTTGEVYTELLKHPELVARIDVIAINVYPYWEGIDIGHALAAVHDAYQEVLKIAGGKPVIVSETGWPTCGNPVGAAIPSLANSRFFALNFLAWAQVNDVPYFYFEALDETWKAGYEGPQGSCWGIWDKSGNLKEGMGALFDDLDLPDNWSGTEVVGGQGEPTVSLTFVPRRGSSDDLKGQVLHVVPNDHRVAVYIKVASRWWTKPTFAQSTSRVWPDGSWTCDITTGGNDPSATAITACLIPRSYLPPAAAGILSLPPELFQNARDCVEVSRP